MGTHGQKQARRQRQERSPSRQLKPSRQTQEKTERRKRPCAWNAGPCRRHTYAPTVHRPVAEAFFVMRCRPWIDWAGPEAKEEQHTTSAQPVAGQQAANHGVLIAYRTVTAVCLHLAHGVGISCIGSAKDALVSPPDSSAIIIVSFSCPDLAIVNFLAPANCWLLEQKSTVICCLRGSLSQP